MHNLERKFICPDLAAAENAALRLGATDRGIAHQRDLFFPAPLARLKLRINNATQSAELISYRRADSHDARISEFHIAPVSNPESLAAALTQALGQPQELAKIRHLFIYRSTRIHLDKVDGRGSFVELETLLTGGGLSVEAAEEELRTVVHALGLSQTVPGAYVDLPAQHP
jgi:adenylate cyclase class IV